MAGWKDRVLSNRQYSITAMEKATYIYALFYLGIQ